MRRFFQVKKKLMSPQVPAQGSTQQTSSWWGWEHYNILPVPWHQLGSTKEERLYYSQKWWWEKERQQWHYLQMTIKEAYSLYNEGFQQHVVNLIKFLCLRPKSVLLLSYMPRNQLCALIKRMWTCCFRPWAKRRHYLRPNLACFLSFHVTLKMKHACLAIMQRAESVSLWNSWVWLPHHKMIQVSCGFSGFRQKRRWIWSVSKKEAPTRHWLLFH